MFGASLLNGDLFVLISSTTLRTEYTVRSTWDETSADAKVKTSGTTMEPQKSKLGHLSHSCVKKTPDFIPHPLSIPHLHACVNVYSTCVCVCACESNGNVFSWRPLTASSIQLLIYHSACTLQCVYTRFDKMTKHTGAELLSSHTHVQTYCTHTSSLVCIVAIADMFTVETIRYPPAHINLTRARTQTRTHVLRW